MVALNQALRAYQDSRFTDGDVVRCTGLTTRALRELLKVGAVRSITERRGPGLVRLFDSTTFKRAAIIAALHAAGFSLATAGRIAYFIPFEELLFAVCDPFTILFMQGTAEIRIRDCRGRGPNRVLIGSTQIGHLRLILRMIGI